MIGNIKQKPHHIIRIAFALNDSFVLGFCAGDGNGGGTKLGTVMELPQPGHTASIPICSGDAEMCWPQ
jgi:hypothetical protein